MQRILLNAVMALRLRCKRLAFLPGEAGRGQGDDMRRVFVERLAGRRLEVRAGESTAIVDRDEDGFRSTELLLGSLGACTIGTMLSAAEEAGIEVGAVRAELSDVTSLATDTVTRARMTLHLDAALTDEQVALLTEAAASCKVHRSLHAGIETALTVRTEDGPAS